MKQVPSLYLYIMILWACDDVVVLQVPGGTNGKTHDGGLVTSGQFTDRMELSQIPDTNLLIIVFNWRSKKKNKKHNNWFLLGNYLLIIYGKHLINIVYSISLSMCSVHGTAKCTLFTCTLWTVICELYCWPYLLQLRRDRTLTELNRYHW